MSQQKEDFVASVENAIHFFGGTPAAIVPDNLKSAVIKSSRFEPTINETLADFAEHYETTILPARAYKPRDKSLVEGAVKILYRRIYVHLKEQKFFSLEELNNQIWDLLDEHNNKKLTARPYSRSELFSEDEKDKLRPLPQERFEIKYQSFATVMQNGHVLLSQDKSYYSVPYQYLRKKAKLLYTKSTVEIYYKYNRIATHPRNYKPYVYTTNPEHLAVAQGRVGEAGRADGAVDGHLAPQMAAGNDLGGAVQLGGVVDGPEGADAISLARPGPAAVVEVPGLHRLAGM